MNLHVKSAHKVFFTFQFLGIRPQRLWTVFTLASNFYGNIKVPPAEIYKKIWVIAIHTDLNMGLMFCRKISPSGESFVVDFFALFTQGWNTCNTMGPVLMRNSQKKCVAIHARCTPEHVTSLSYRWTRFCLSKYYGFLFNKRDSRYRFKSEFPTLWLEELLAQN